MVVTAPEVNPDAVRAEAGRLAFTGSAALYLWLAGERDLFNIIMGSMRVNDGQIGMYYAATSWLIALEKHSGIDPSAPVHINVVATHPDGDGDRPVKFWCNTVGELFFKKQSKAMYAMFADDNPALPVQFCMTTLINGIASAIQTLPEGYARMGTVVPKASEQPPAHRMWGQPWS